MKKRTGLVSNSSSSSFIVIVNDNIDEQIQRDLDYVRSIEILDDSTRKNIINRVNANKDEYRHDKEKSTIDINSRILLTNFISDGDDAFGDFALSSSCYMYCEGSHGGPYNENDFIEIDVNKDIFVLMEDMQ